MTRPGSAATPTASAAPRGWQSRRTRLTADQVAEIRALIDEARAAIRDAARK